MRKLNYCIKIRKPSAANRHPYVRAKIVRNAKADSLCWWTPLDEFGYGDLTSAASAFCSRWTNDFPPAQLTRSRGRAAMPKTGKGQGAGTSMHKAWLNVVHFSNTNKSDQIRQITFPRHDSTRNASDCVTVASGAPIATSNCFGKRLINPRPTGPWVTTSPPSPIMGSSTPSPPRGSLTIRPGKPVRPTTKTGRTSQALSAGSARKRQVADPGFLFVDLVDVSHRDRRELRSHVMKRVVHQKKRKKEIISHGEVQLLLKEAVEVVEAPKVDKYLPAGRVDPFNCLALSMTSSMHQLFDHYATILGPLHYPPPRCQGRNPMTLTWISSALHDDALLHSTLCSSGGFLHGNANKPSRDPQLLANYYQHKAEAMRLVNERVSSTDLNLATSDGTLGAVALLVTGQTVHGDFNEMMAHMRGMARLVELRGGLSRLGMGGLLAGELIWCDNISAFIIGSRPLFDLPPNIFSTLTTFTDPEINALFDAPPPTAENSLLYRRNISSVLSEDLIPVLQDLNTMTTLLNLIPALTETDMLVYDRKRAILQHSLARLQDSSASTKREFTTAACLLAAIGYSILALWGFRPPMESYNNMAYRFKPAFLLTDLGNHWGAWWEMLLWALFISGFISGGTDERFWFYEKIQIICRDKGLSSFKTTTGNHARLIASYT
ncbi:hypothetical protein B7463_g6993, partial [Scytalidium lignicola]